MACKTCKVHERDNELLLAEVERLRELVEAKRRYAKEVEVILEEERAKKESVPELLRTASAAAQIAKISVFPGASVVLEASAVALAALKQVRERLEEGAKDAGARQEA